MTKPTKLCATGCGRTAYVGDYCKTHHVKGAEYQIRTYSPRGEGRVEYAGIPVLTRTRDALVRAEKRAELAARTLVGVILDAWAVGKVWGPMLARAGIGVVTLLMVGGLAGGVGLHCSPLRAARGTVVVGETLTLPIPTRPFEGQARPPCDEESEKEINGGCWIPLHDLKTGKQLRRCLKAPRAFQDKDGLCWIPAMPPLPGPIPQATEPQIR